MVAVKASSAGGRRKYGIRITFAPTRGYTNTLGGLISALARLLAPTPAESTLMQGTGAEPHPIGGSAAASVSPPHGFADI